jgi:hypothetical protein
MEPIRIAPPTADSAGKAESFTESLPPGSFFTAAFAAAGISLPPSATTAQTPAKRERRVIGSILRPYFSLL